MPLSMIISNVIRTLIRDHILFLFLKTITSVSYENTERSIAIKLLYKSYL